MKPCVDFTIWPLAGMVFIFCVFPTFTAAAPPTEFDCRWSPQPIVVDAKLDDAGWKHAQVIDYFYLPWLQENARQAKTATKARLLWDREFLYFAAELEDADLYADIKEHDGQTWHNDVFELFFKPADDKPGYYEFQVNAAGTMMDMFVPQRGEGGYRRFVGAREFHVDAKVRRDGTLNKRQDTDESWTVEGRIPWNDFMATGGRPAVDENWKFALCRYDYSVDFEGPELSTCAPLKSKRSPDFHHHEDYATLVFRGPDKQTALKGTGLEDWQPLKTSRVVGSPEPPLPFTTELAYPELKFDFPVFMVTEPAGRRLYFIDQPRPYASTRVCRTQGDPATGEYDVLLEFEKETAYSLCFHPQFKDNGYVYLGANGAWDEGKEKTCRIIRYVVDREPPHKLHADSATTIIEWASDGHNGVAIAFGLDGMFYVTSGDGTSDSDDNVTGQGLDHLLAKVLRIDVDHPDADRAYSVPKDNPFVGEEGIRPETWAYGLRNPWRMTVDEKTGHIWVGNNGQDLWEQAYLVRKGDNYGWSVYEGSHPFYLNRKLGPHPHVKPTVEHPHSEARSLTGGIVYYGSKLPELQGAYIYGDHSTGKIWGVKHNGEAIEWHRELVDTPFNITAFAQDADGELLVADHRGEGEGGFHRLVPNDAPGYDPADFPRKLSESGLFDSVAEHEMANGLIPYSVNSPLWSDGAFKARWIALPPTMLEDGKEVPTRIDARANRGWEFPDKTVLVKSFGLEMKEGDPASRRWIETRFLTKQQGEWLGYSYAWNDEQTEAFLVEGDGRDRKFEVHTTDGEARKQTWRYPSRTECMVCHARAAKFVLGLTTLQMNKVHDYGDHADEQLRVLEALGVLQVNYKSDVQANLRKRLEAKGVKKADIDKRLRESNATRNQREATATSSLLSGSPDEYDALVDPYDETADLNMRARSYLHANCSVCHVKAGGGNAQIELEFTTERDKMNLLDVPPIHHKFDIQDARLIAPGDPDRSVLLHRVAIRGRGQMPQLATSIVDERAVAMLREWILSLKK